MSFKFASKLDPLTSYSRTYEGATLPVLRAHTVTRVNHEGSEMVDFLLDRYINTGVSWEKSFLHFANLLMFVVCTDLTRKQFNFVGTYFRWLEKLRGMFSPGSSSQIHF